MSLRQNRFSVFPVLLRAIQFPLKSVTFRNKKAIIDIGCSGDGGERECRGEWVRRGEGERMTAPRPLSLTLAHSPFHFL